MITLCGTIVSCMALPSGKTLMSGGADGWVHTWQVEDGRVAFKGRPSTQGAGKPPLEQKAVVLLRKVGTSQS